ncbi:coiled-coil domain-containing protein 74A [Engraulis encrasicolus]|uniref:coiled-coil domain-containing protein 74A n=1 Tax=Engraulis encrasicolus TaxID=184585 RepID=UPI002FD3D373
MEPLKSCRKGSSYRTPRPQPEGQRFLPERGVILEHDPNVPQDKMGLSGPPGNPVGPSAASAAEGPSLSKQQQQQQQPQQQGSGSQQQLMGGLITSLQPLMIHCSPQQPPRPPTLQECEVIIRQLYNANSLQSQEIMHIKAVLRDIIFSKKISPENYIITKAYLGSGDRAVDTSRFPNLPLRQLPKRIVSQVSLAKRVILPALRQSQGMSIAERQRRVQATRAHLKRSVLHKDTTQRQPPAPSKHLYHNFNTG